MQGKMQTHHHPEVMAVCGVTNYQFWYTAKSSMERRPLSMLPAVLPSPSLLMRKRTGPLIFIRKVMPFATPPLEAASDTSLPICCQVVPWLVEYSSLQVELASV